VISWDGGAVEAMTRQRAMLFRIVRKDGSSFVAEVQANSQWEDPVIGGMAVYIRPCDERMLLDRAVWSCGDGPTRSPTTPAP
jgi:hypothetical protein